MVVDVTTPCRGDVVVVEGVLAVASVKLVPPVGGLVGKVVVFGMNRRAKMP